MKQEIYTSSTHGEILLSFTGRHLLQSLREAIEGAIGTGDYHFNANAVSRARGQLAHYMSHLESFKSELRAEQERKNKTPTDELNEDSLEAFIGSLFNEPGKLRAKAIRPSTLIFTEKALRDFFGWTDEDFKNERDSK